MLKPTTELYAELQEIFDFFNQKLFIGELPNCLISLQRSKGAAGYFAYSSWENDKGKKIDEIALNPSNFKNKDLKTILSTFVHEMCHLWQSYFGKVGKNGYHNQEWAEKMQAIGLIPSHTGKRGGNQTGYKMSHFVLKDGLYEKSFNELEKLGGKMSWIESIGEQKKNYVKKIKYVCPECNIKLWGKPNLNIICGDCNTALQLS
jgi:predicted SprT family Zn-dependent metalloprotease